MNPRSNCFTQGLPRPYDHLDEVRDLSRLSADIPAVDKDLIKHICPKRGILNQITQNIFHSLCENLRKQNITYYSPENEQYLIDTILRGCTAIESAEQATPRNVHRRVEGSNAAVAGGQQQCRDSQEASDHHESGSQEVNLEPSTQG